MARRPSSFLLVPVGYKPAGIFAFWGWSGTCASQRRSFGHIRTFDQVMRARFGRLDLPQ